VIHIHNLSKSYGDFFKLSIPDLTIPDRKIVGVVGNNGAGKTTLLRCILDLVKFDSGDIFINDFKVNKDAQWKIITGSYLDERFLIDHLTAFEYFRISAELYKIPPNLMHERLNSYRDFISSLDIQNTLIRDLSSGNKKKTGLVSNFIVEPSLFIFDEPFASLDPSSRNQLKSILKTLQEKENITMLISSHDLDYIYEICDEIIVLQNGAISRTLNKQEHNLEDLKELF
jgi:ABC-2 type transport system ATP-binding protein